MFRAAHRKWPGEIALASAAGFPAFLAVETAEVIGVFVPHLTGDRRKARVEAGRGDQNENVPHLSEP